MKPVYIVSAMRTAIGSFGGSLKDVPVTQLATTAIKSAIAESKAPASSVGLLVLGNVIPSEPRDAYMSRVAALDAGVPKEATCFNVNRLCSSGLQAVVTAAQGIITGDAEGAVAGGAESMSRGGYITPSARWGARMGDVQSLDFTTGILHDPFHQESISRAEQDAYALESQNRAINAIKAGYFKSQIAPVEIVSKKGTVKFETDEHPRASTLEALAKMKPAFKKDGTVTADNSSGINDGAAAIVLASESAVSTHGLKPLARIFAWGHAGVDPLLMGLGPVPATHQAMKKAGFTVADMDVIEANEAFAAQALGVAKNLNFDLTKTNPHGSGISLGHPVGATGAVIMTKAVHELQRVGGKYALVTLCIGGGQGLSVIIERM